MQRTTLDGRIRLIGQQTMTLREVFNEMKDTFDAYQNAGISGPEKARNGVHLQQKLTALLIKLAPSNRAFFFKVMNRPLWIKHFTGATAVAILAGDLLRQGLEVYLPHPAEDLTNKIDLIAIETKQDRNRGFCFQVKGRGNGFGQLEWSKTSYTHVGNDIAMILGALGLVVSSGIGWTPLTVTLNLPQEAYLTIGDFNVFSKQATKMMATV